MGNFPMQCHQKLFIDFFSLLFWKRTVAEFYLLRMIGSRPLKICLLTASQYSSQTNIPNLVNGWTAGRPDAVVILAMIGASLNWRLHAQ